MDAGTKADARRSLMHSYRAYSLRIDSELALPQLPPGAGPPDIVVRCADPAPIGRDEERLEANAREVRVRLTGIGEVAIRRGREVVVAPHPGADPGSLQLLATGSGLGVALTQRGLDVLHGSAVAIGGRGVAFVGASGSGKSTLAAAAQRRGHRGVTDDLVVIANGSSAPVFLPSSPALRLQPETAASLGVAGAAGVSGSEKRFWQLADGVPTAAIPLKAVYVIADAPEPAIEPLDPRLAVIELVRHSYSVRVLERIDGAGHLRACASLAASVPVRRLGRPRSLEALDAVIEMVERDA